ncbi:MAG TPA: hypothetical protein VF275_03235 [Gammaproteobacteria bacterium]
MAELLYKVMLAAHAIAGLAALGAFWIPALTKKGSRVHRAAGKTFLVAMIVVIVTGVPLALRFFLLGEWVIAVFLLYIAIITGVSVGTAWYALQLKREPERYFGPAYRAAMIAMLVSGLGVTFLGGYNGVWLLFFFGFIGPFAAHDMYKRMRPTRDAHWWLQEHLSGMIGGGIAAHVAFGAFGLRQLWPAYADIDGWIGMLPWLAPVAIGLTASAWLERKYARGASSPQPIVKQPRVV